MTHPIALHYSEGSETFAVDAAGNIGRPAIGMAPSGRWRFAGVYIRKGRGGSYVAWPQVVERLKAGESFPAGSTYVRDVDHGTNREHGSPATVWLAPACDVAEVRRLDAERLQAAAVKMDAERLARVRVAEAGRELWRDSRYGIALIEHGRGAARFIVRDGEQATDKLESTAAASAIGWAIMEAAQSEESGA